MSKIGILESYFMSPNHLSAAGGLYLFVIDYQYLFYSHKKFWFEDIWCRKEATFEPGLQIEVDLIDSSNQGSHGMFGLVWVISAAA